MGGAVTEAPEGATVGVVISADPDVEKVRAGLIVPAAEQAAAFSVEKSGFVPGTKYYYAAYLDLGAGVIYGDVKEFTTDAKTFDADADFVDLGLSVKWAKAILARNQSLTSEASSALEISQVSIHRISPKTMLQATSIAPSRTSHGT